MHTLKRAVEQEVWNVSIFRNRALVRSVITLLSQIMSGKEYKRASLSCSGIEVTGVPSLSRWREVVAVRTFLSPSACEVRAAQAPCSESSGHNCSSHAVATASWGGQLGNETAAWTGSVSKTIPSSFSLPSQLYHLCAWEKQSLLDNSSKL